MEVLDIFQSIYDAFSCVSDTNYKYMLLDKNPLFVMSGELGMNEEVRDWKYIHNIFIGIIDPFL